MLFKIYLILLFTCFIIGVIAVYRTKSAPRYLKLLPWFILITFIAEVLGGYVFKYKNGPVYNSFALIEVTFLNYLFYQLIQNKLIRRMIIYMQCAFSVVVLVNSFFIQGISKFNATSYLLGSGLLIFFSGYYLYELFFKNPSLKPFNKPSFWIATGILVFHASSCSVLLAVDHVSSFSKYEIKLIAWFIQTLDILYYSLFIIAFSCILKFRNPQS